MKSYKIFSFIMIIVAAAAFFLAATVSDYILAVSFIALWVGIARYLDGRAAEKAAAAEEDEQ